MKLFHLTPIKNVKSIQEKGLLTNQESFACLEEASCIYLTTNIQALVEQEAEWSSDLAVFSVDWKGYLGLDLKVDWELNYDSYDAPFSYYMIDNIQAKNLKLEGLLVNGKLTKF